METATELQANVEFNLPVNLLRAALELTDDKKITHGIALIRRFNGYRDYELVATDGLVLGVFRGVLAEGDALDMPGQIRLPLDTVKAIVKSSGTARQAIEKTISIYVLSDGFLRLSSNGAMFTVAQDSRKWCEYDAIMERVDDAPEGGPCGFFNLFLLLRFQTAFNHLLGLSAKSDKRMIDVRHQGDREPALVLMPAENFRGCVLPMRR